MNVDSDSDAALIVNNLVVGNAASIDGGGVRLGDALGTVYPTLVNNTVADNATGSGSGVIVNGSGTRTYNNVITDGVECVGTVGLLHSNNASSFTGTCSGAAGINGNLSQPPMFINPATGNYALHQGSPSIDAGDNGAPSIPDSDIRGIGRIVNGTIDQGAYEFYVPKQPVHLSDNNLLHRRAPLPLGAASSSVSASSGTPVPATAQAQTAASSHTGLSAASPVGTARTTALKRQACRRLSTKKASRRWATSVRFW